MRKANSSPTESMLNSRTAINSSIRVTPAVGRRFIAGTPAPQNPLAAGCAGGSCRAGRSCAGRRTSTRFPTGCGRVRTRPAAGVGDDFSAMVTCARQPHSRPPVSAGSKHAFLRHVARHARIGQQAVHAQARQLDDAVVVAQAGGIARGAGDAAHQTGDRDPHDGGGDDHLEEGESAFAGHCAAH